MNKYDQYEGYHSFTILLRVPVHFDLPQIGVWQVSNKFQPCRMGVSHKKLQTFIISYQFNFQSDFCRGIHKFETHRTWQSRLCHDTPLPCSPASSLEKTCDASQSPESGLISTTSTSNTRPKFGSRSQLLSAFPSATLNPCWASFNSMWKRLKNNDWKRTPDSTTEEKVGVSNKPSPHNHLGLVTLSQICPVCWDNPPIKDWPTTLPALISVGKLVVKINTWQHPKFVCTPLVNLSSFWKTIALSTTSMEKEWTTKKSKHQDSRYIFQEWLPQPSVKRGSYEIKLNEFPLLWQNHCFVLPIW